MYAASSARSVEVFLHSSYGFGVFVALMIGATKSARSALVKRHAREAVCRVILNRVHGAMGRGLVVIAFMRMVGGLREL